MSVSASGEAAGCRHDASWWPRLWMNRLRCNCRVMRLLRHCPYQPGSLTRLGAGEFDHLAPLLDFFHQYLSEVGGCAGDHDAAEVGEACLDPWIGNRPVDLPVELGDDVGRRVLGRADAVDPARLVAWNEIGHDGKVRERLGARRGCHRQT